MRTNSNNTTSAGTVKSGWTCRIQSLICIQYAKSNKYQNTLGWTEDLLLDVQNKSAEFFFNVFMFDVVNNSLNFNEFGLSHQHTRMCYLSST